ncbi:MAG: ribonuclease D [Alphaproteobacteria bacterium]
MEIITTSNQLKDYCKEIEKYPFITVDTEFLREKTYFAQLCLIQVSTPDYETDKSGQAIIDPLSDIDLSPFFEILKNKNIIKVFHSASQDIEIFYNLMNEMPVNIFDTQIGAMAIGIGEQIGYEAIVNKVCKITIDKGARYTDWSKRPLTDKQLDYAIKDTTYLVEVYKYIIKRIEDKNRMSWISEEMDKINNEYSYKIIPENTYKKIKFRTNKPVVLANMREVSAWRETKAIEKNIPKRHYMKDETIIDISSNNITNEKQLIATRNFPKGWIGTDKVNEILSMLDKVRNMDKSDYPEIKKQEPINNGGKAVADLLRSLLKECGEEHNVSVALIAKSSDIDDFVKDHNNSPLLQSWKKEIFGDKALDLKNGKIALCVKDNQLTFIDV